MLSQASNLQHTDITWRVIHVLRVHEGGVVKPSTGPLKIRRGHAQAFCTHCLERCCCISCLAGRGLGRLVCPAHVALYAQPVVQACRQGCLLDVLKGSLHWSHASVGRCCFCTRLRLCSPSQSVLQLGSCPLLSSPAACNHHVPCYANGMQAVA